MGQSVQIKGVGWAIGSIVAALRIAESGQGQFSPLPLRWRFAIRFRPNGWVQWASVWRCNGESPPNLFRTNSRRSRP